MSPSDPTRSILSADVASGTSATASVAAASLGFRCALYLELLHLAERVMKEYRDEHLSNG